MNKLVVIAAGAVGVAVASVVVSVVTVVKSNRALKKIERSLGKVEELTEEKISDKMIQKAVEKATDEKVDKYMRDTEDQVLRTASRNLDIQARNAVESAAVTIREQASERISQQVAALDIEQLKKRVCDQAEKHVLQKLDGCLDASAKKFQEQLDSTRKIYERIAKAMAEKEEEDDSFHVVLL